MTLEIIVGDCVKKMRALSENSVDAIVTDPPYGLEFMGKAWDGADGFRRSLNAADSGRDNLFGRQLKRGPEYRAGHLFQTWCEAWAREALRVLKPGGHMLAFGGTRTYHRLACAIEDAGFEIRDCIRSLNGDETYPAWVYGSGFPKSLDVSKAIDKAAGAEREVVSAGQAVKRMIPGADQNATGSWIKDNGREYVPTVTEPATDAARQWQGWGTALKPAWEPIVVARKPLIGTVAENALAHGTGAMNIDACRVATADALGGGGQKGVAIEGKHEGWARPWMHDPEAVAAYAARVNASVQKAEALGRWPANLIHDGSDEVVALFPETTSGSGNKNVRNRDDRVAYGKGLGAGYGLGIGGDTGSAARFFYCAKASKSDRGANNDHPTVKPEALMRYLCRLVTPPGGLILDPFTGSGSTGRASVLEGFRFIGIEQDIDYAMLAHSRIAAAVSA